MTNNSIKIGQFRQGEIWLVPVREGFDISGRVVHDVGNRALLAVGETGNDHTLNTLVDTEKIEWLLQAADDINRVRNLGATAAQGVPVLRIAGQAVITHSDRANQHTEIQVPAGVYYSVIKREQLPWEQEARAVAD